MWPVVLIVDGFRAYGLAPPTPQVVSDSTAVRTRLVEMGLFLTFLPGSTLHLRASWLRVKAFASQIIHEGATYRDHYPKKIGHQMQSPNSFIAELHSFAKPLK